MTLDPLVISGTRTPESLARDIELAYRNIKTVIDGLSSADVTGTVVLAAGTATVHTTAITSTSIVMLSGQNQSGTAGELTVSARTPKQSFVITSTSNTDTRKVAWVIKGS